ncbi:MAG: hypothetical protein LBB26_02925 [Puniceicoccales bacterium]|jgi:hypothetical protein|nr:hypothetical protein [Puniceicoccales bacterium]
MVNAIKVADPNLMALFPVGLEAVENPAAREPVGIPAKLPTVTQPRIRNRRIGTPRRRRAPAHFIRASSPELERQVWELVSGQIDEIPKPPPGTRRVIIAAPESTGERRFCMQLGDALTQFGCEWCVCSEIVAHMAKKMNSNLFISSASWMRIRPPGSESGVISLLYVHTVYSAAPKNYQKIDAYDNFLFVRSGTDKLEEYFRKNGKNFRQLKTYLTLAKTDFCDQPKKRIAFVGYLHDSRLRDELAKLFQLLDETGYCDFYGPARVWQKKNLRSWKGEIPARGPTDVQDVMEPAGIALLLHSKHHFESGSPVYRDFEALSSSCAIITEKTAFMVDNFGDCVLFIDADKPVEEIFAQIDAHVKWIHAHPEEAIEMARKSHQRFCDKFSLEGECEKILKFVDEIAAASSEAQREGQASEQEIMVESF